MRNLNLLLILVITLLFTACKKEEERFCVKSDFIGDFVGTSNCSGNGIAVGAIIRVRDRTEENVINVDIDGFSLDVTIDGCNFSGTDVNNNVDVTFSGDLNGETIKVKLKGVVFGVPIDCDAEGEKNI